MSREVGTQGRVGKAYASELARIGRSVVCSLHRFGARMCVSASPSIKGCRPSCLASIIPRLLGWQFVILGTVLNWAPAHTAEVTARGDNLIILELGADELVPGNPFDLEGKTLRFTPEGAGYRIEAIPLKWDPNFGSEIEGFPSAEVTLNNFPFPFSGITWSKVFVSTFGNITFGTDQSGFYDRERDRFLLFREFGRSMINTVPIISPLFRKFGSELGPDVDGVNHRFSKELGDRLVLTWIVSEPYRNVFDFTSDPLMNRFQVVLYDNGIIEMSYEDIAVKDGIVGVFPLNREQQLLGVIADPQDNQLPSYIDIIKVRFFLVGNHSLRFEFETRGDLLPEGDPKLNRIFYQVFVDLDEPFVQGVDFGDADLEWQILVSPELKYQTFGPGVSLDVAVDGNKISFTVGLGTLGVNERFAFFTEAVDFDDQPGPFDVTNDQTNAILLDLPSAARPEIHLSNASTSDPVRSIVYESFYYADVPSGAELACAVITELGNVFDLLTFYTDFRIDRPEASARSLGPIGDAVSGVFQPRLNSEVFCSDGRLLGGQVATYVGSPMFAREGTDTIGPFDNYNRHIRLLAHEIGHSWLTTKEAIVSGQTVAIGDNGHHWVIGLHTPVAFPITQSTEASVMNGSYWQDNGNGTFTILSEPFFQARGYSYLDLYLMGFLPKESVPDFFVIQNIALEGSDGDGNQLWSGDRLNISVDDEIAANGPRLPPFEDSQKVFNIGFVGIVQHESVPSAILLERMTGIRPEWRNFWPVATGGVSTMTSLPGRDLDNDGRVDSLDSDDDNDGMPDAYEIANGFDPVNPSDANQDADGDGFTNLKEFRAGTDPNDPTSVPKVLKSMPWLQLLLDD